MKLQIREIVRERNQARKAYSAKRAEALDLMHAIRRSLDRHAKGPVGWDSVGDLGYVCQQLHEAATFIYREGDES